MAEPIIFDEKHRAETNQITISPGTRLDGHVKIEIFLDSFGNVDECFFQIVELRGFEEFCKGRPVEELPRIVTQLCGICPWAHHLASSKALDMMFDVDPPKTAKMLREAAYCGHYIHSHISHFYALGAPDFVRGPGAPASKRNVVGVIEAVGRELGAEVLHARVMAQDIQARIGGRATHPVFGLPGGISKPISKEDRAEMLSQAKTLLEFAKKTVKILEAVVLSNKAYLDIITNKDLYYHESYHMGLVDENNHANFYDGKVRVIDPKGKEFTKFEAKNYLEEVAEQVMPWSYLKFPYLRKVGWKGLTDGPESGLTRVAPLSRLNVSKGMATPLANAEWQRFMDTLGGAPVHFSLANHWARVIELVYACERLVELLSDDQILDPKVRNIPTANKRVGMGIVEAPRGTLIHHYESDENAMVTKVNMIVATAFNHGAICIDTAKAARGLIKDGMISDGILNMVEMAFRAYDPCFSCATHSLPGQMPLEVRVHNSSGEITQTLRK
ncbi:MAG TPA: Ni/Fe hydrogenase subunit alpha [Caldisericia bacterium]|nr:Ni/Fe hydrogenase subunit alpha [Caldisericia bacterium]HOC80177.1 Ni/Fe hydrogenase subunit alpha [Caldisericia bacterium]HOG70558.1 Ni/Fe hydrogenase subunit alpha [Caldisericia bacterium]HPA65183.1 Ni/Fe hydrogenase subunit alpha [Caldisericia bacterium]HPM44394.1 Ni/Fe hydrogenase subunit alpha [Caldisericia bacterium]